MNNEMVDQIRRRMEEKDTEELLVLWQKNDREEWSDEAFEAIQQVLSARGENLPEQSQIEVKEEPESEKSTWDICEKCKSRAKGNRYQFYYGTSTTKTEYAYSRMTTTTRYNNLEEETLYLCDQCVSKASKAGDIIGAIILFVVAAFFATITIAFSTEEDAPVWFLCIFGAIALLLFYLMIIKISQAKKGQFGTAQGESLAMSLRMSELRAKGYNAFLTPQQYSQLKIDVRIK